MSNRKTSLNSLIFKNLISTTFLLIPAIILLISVLYFFAMEKFANSVSEITTQREINNNESLIIKEAEVISVKLKEIEDTNLSLDIQAESYPHSIGEWTQKQALRKEHFNILLGQEIYWEQHSRIQLLKEGDLNTSFSQKIVNSRRKTNSLISASMV